MDDRSVMNLKSSDRLKQEIDNEQICSSFNRLLSSQVLYRVFAVVPFGQSLILPVLISMSNSLSFIGHNGKVLRKVDCYVPDFLAIEDWCYDDYICIKIDEDGKINNFQLNDDDIEDIINYEL